MEKLFLELNPVLQDWLKRARIEGKPCLLDEFKRANGRTIWTSPADVLVIDEDGARRLISRIRDISREGIGIHCRIAIPVGSAIRVYSAHPDLQDEFVDGTVAHCTMTVGGYKIGGVIESDELSLSSLLF